MTPRFANEWLLLPRPSAKPRVRLFCIPYAGGGPQIFFRWAELLPRDIEVAAVNLPGRGRRLAESPFTSLVPLAAALARSIASLGDLPFAFFGHSMGARIAFETSRQMDQDYRLRPRHLFVSGALAPHIPYPHLLHEMPDDRFLEEVGKLGGVPAEVFENADLMELILPTLRADFRVAETYSLSPDSPLTCPITAFGGDTDSLAQSNDIAEWKRHTTHKFDMRMYQGGHFFLDSALPDMLDVIVRELASAAGLKATR